MFQEIKRVLRNDGLLRIVVPNFELLHKSIINDDKTLMESIKFKGRPEWERHNIEFNNINFILHWFANYTNYPEEKMLFKKPNDFSEGLLKSKEKKF